MDVQGWHRGRDHFCFSTLHAVVCASLAHKLVCPQSLEGVSNGCEFVVTPCTGATQGRLDINIRLNGDQSRVLEFTMLPVGWRGIAAWMRVW